MRYVHLSRRAAILAASVSLLAMGMSSALADSTIKWLHLETNPERLAAMEDVAKAYESSHPGVNVELQFLENEAFKAKLPTLLQSNDPPSLFYTWGGGVLKEQSETGKIRAIDAALDANGGEWRNQLSQGAISAMTFDGKVWAAPFKSGVVSFWYNKELFDKAGVDGTAIHTWDDFTQAVQKLKDAGITPLACGGGDKWPIHFYWSYLAMREAGQAGFEAAKAGENGGFTAEPFIKAGQLLADLGKMEPCQDGWQGATWPETVPVFDDGRAAMILGFENMATPTSQAANATDGKGLSQDNIGRFPFPTIEGGSGTITEDFGGINGWVVTAAAPPETEDFVKFLTNAENESKFVALGDLPVIKGAEGAITDPTLKDVAAQMAKATWHQNYVDQDLGPNVGRVVNDMSVGVFAGEVSPEDASQQIEDAHQMEM
jgi:raffinose/stachyose/melibiose transport system substrate-binding protein